MAIDQEILVAFSPRDDKQLKISNWNESYPELSCELDGFRYTLIIFPIFSDFIFILLQY